jgi:outer membrane lipoprotein carrier protein
MKKLFTLLLLASVVFADAQVKDPAKNPTTNDPAAKKILDAVSAKFKTYKSPLAAFSYKVENAQGKALSSKKGTVIMKGNKYKVTMDGMEIYSDGKTSWNFDKSANEVTINTVDASGNAMTPQKLLTNFYDKDFYYKYNGEKKDAGKTVQEIELTPTDKNKSFHKVYLLVNKATSSISSARFLEKAGGRYTYSITSLNGTASVKDGDFVFDKAKHPGVEVVDLR